MVSEGLSERVKKVRKDMKLSRPAFGELLHVSVDEISNIELNRLSRPERKIPLLQNMAQKTGVREEWLLDGEGPMREDTARSGEMAAYVASTLAGNEGSIQKGVLDLLLTLMASLIVEQWELIAQKAREIAEEQKRTEG